MREILFGKHLELHVGTLRARLGPAKFNEAIRAFGLNVRSMNELAEGTWNAIGHQTLFALTALATQHGISRFVEVRDSGFWETFRKSKRNTVLAGQDKDGHHFEGDFEVPQVLIRAGINVGFSDVRRSERADTIKNLMRERNLLILGSSKNNVAAHVAFCALWPQGPPFRFLSPDIDRETSTIGRSPNANRMLELHGERLEESGDQSRIGIVVICKNPFNKKGITTLIVAGCSRQATNLMIKELQGSDFYRHYPSELDKRRGEPILFVFDSSKEKRGRWRVDGFDPGLRKRGRPKKGAPRPSG